MDTLPFQRRSIEPEYEILIKLPDLEIRFNVNVEISVMRETLSKFVFSKEEPTGIGEGAIAWLDFLERVTHPDDMRVLNEHNLSIGQMEIIAASALSQLARIGIEVE